MRVFTFALFVLTVLAGILAYYGAGTLTEIVKLTYAYLACSTVACGAISVSMRKQTAARAGVQTEVETR